MPPTEEFTALEARVQSVQKDFPNLTFIVRGPTANLPATAFVNVFDSSIKGNVYQIQIQPDAGSIAEKELRYLARWVSELGTRSKDECDETVWPRHMSLAATLKRSEETNWLVFLIALRPGFSNVTQRKLLIAQFLNLLLDHQRAIIDLIRSHHFGSAMALVRCVDEIMYKGLWAIAHASEDEAGKIYNGKEFPLKMGQLVTQVDVAFDTKDYFQTMKKNNWQVQNSFTHAGMMQFRRRVKGNRLEDNYPEEELKLALRMTLISAVLLAIPYVEMCGNPTATIQLKLVFKLLTDQLQTITDTPEQVRFE